MLQADDRKPVLAVIAGPNGSGKTTITEALLSHRWLQGCEYINPDNIANVLGDWNDPVLSIRAAQQAEGLREQLLSERKSIAFETVFSAPDKLEFVRRAHEAGYYTRLFFVSTNCPSINAARITKRYLQGGHEVPISKIVNRYYKSIQQCVDIIPYLDRLDAFDNSQNGKEWVRLFKYGPDSNLIRYLDEADLPDWAIPIYQETVLWLDLQRNKA